MMTSERGKRSGWRLALAAITFGTVAAVGVAASPAAKADEGRHHGWRHHEEWRHRDWDRDRHDWDWGWRHPYRYSYGYGYGWYNPPPVVYAPAPPPVVYAPPPYYGSLNVYIPLR